MLLNRPLLSIFQSVYAFVVKDWFRKEKEMSLWETVDCEFNVLLGCLPFLQARLSLEWRNTVYEVDAGPKLC